MPALETEMLLSCHRVTVGLSEACTAAVSCVECVGGVASGNQPASLLLRDTRVGDTGREPEMRVVGDVTSTFTMCRARPA